MEPKEVIFGASDSFNIFQTQSELGKRVQNSLLSWIGVVFTIIFTE